MGRGLRIAGLGAAMLALAGCGPNAVDHDDLAQVVSDRLAQQVGRQPDSVTCPKDLPAEVGSSIRCTLTEGGQSLDVTVTVTSVADEVRFSIEVAEQPSSR